MIKPINILAFAEELLGGNEPPETIIRTSISRSYYAAYHFAVRKYASAKGFTIRQVIDMGHARFIKELRRDTNLLLVRLGNQLHELKLDREKADYDLESDITKPAGKKTLSFAIKAKSTADSI